MGSQIIASAHAPVEITKSHKVGLRYAVLEFWKQELPYTVTQTGIEILWDVEIKTTTKIKHTNLT